MMDLLVADSLFLTHSLLLTHLVHNLTHFRPTNKNILQTLYFSLWHFISL